jgi:hypothetical protein
MQGCLRVVGWAAAVALVVVIGLYIAINIYVRHAQTPPDVAGIARSQPVAAADRAAASAMSADLKALAPDGASWLAYGPTAVSDLCVSHQNVGFIGSWTGTRCERTITAYFFFNGSFEQHMRAWDTALRATGWITTGDPLSLPLSYYAKFGHKPEPGDPRLKYLATSLPLSAPYYRALPGSPAPGQSVDLVFRWAERPAVSPAFPVNDETPGAATVIAWIQKATAASSGVESAAFDRYQFVAVATLSLVYYDLMAPVRTSITNSEHENCRTGSETCG